MKVTKLAAAVTLAAAAMSAQVEPRFGALITHRLLGD